MGRSPLVLSLVLTIIGALLVLLFPRPMNASVAPADRVTPWRGWRWLRNSRFDTTLIVGAPAVGIATGLFVSAWPVWFVPILILDLWFLGYHHVIATYTRLCFDRQSWRDSRFLVMGMLPLVAVATIAVAWIAGLWVITSVYFYWQWFHYARQSWGVSRSYRAKERDASFESGALDQAIFYSVPVLGILYRSHEDPGTFLGMNLRMVPVPKMVVTAAAVATTMLLVLWVVRRLRAWSNGTLPRAHTLYMSTHVGIFGMAYLVIPDISHGWLAINIWHNVQYILFVWLFNTRRFARGIEPEARLLSYISQPHRLWLYLLVCVGITGVVYWGVLGTMEAFFFAGLPATVVLYQVVNFHHYIVDARIWKVRAGPVRETLGLSG